MYTHRFFFDLIRQINRKTQRPKQAKQISSPDVDQVNQQN